MTHHRRAAYLVCLVQNHDQLGKAHTLAQKALCRLIQFKYAGARNFVPCTGITVLAEKRSSLFESGLLLSEYAHEDAQLRFELYPDNTIRGMKY